MKLDIAVIYGSVRSDRQGIKAARFMVNKLAERGHQVTLVDVNEHPLPLLDRMYKEFNSGAAPEPMEAVARILERADGYVIVCAEYNHSVPPALKNLLDHFQQEYLYKPSAIVTYSAGPFGGVRGLVNMRGILAELGTPSIPSAFPISAVQDAFDDKGQPADPAYERRVVPFLDEFEWYGEALKRQRERETCNTRIPTQQDLCRGDG